MPLLVKICVCVHIVFELPFPHKCFTSIKHKKGFFQIFFWKNEFSCQALLRLPILHKPSSPCTPNAQNSLGEPIKQTETNKKISFSAPFPSGLRPIRFVGSKRSARSRQKSSGARRTRKPKLPWVGNKLPTNYKFSNIGICWMKRSAYGQPSARKAQQIGISQLGRAARGYCCNFKNGAKIGFWILAHPIQFLQNFAPRKLCPTKTICSPAAIWTTWAALHPDATPPAGLTIFRGVKFIENPKNFWKKRKNIIL